jgi:hypothetical protein
MWKDRLDPRDPQARENRGHREHRGQLDHRGQREHLEHREHRELLDPLALRVHPEKTGWEAEGL